GAGDLAGAPVAASQGALDEALEVDRRVLAGEVDVPAAPSLDPVERGELADLEVGVRAADVGIAARPGVVRPTVVRGPRPWEGAVEVGQVVVDHRLRRRPGVAGEAVAAADVGAADAAGERDQDAGPAGLVDGRLPAALDDPVRVHVGGEA